MAVSFTHVPFPQNMPFSSQNDRLGDGVGDKDGVRDSVIDEDGSFVIDGDVIDGDVINGDVIDDDVINSVTNVSENAICVVGKISTVIVRLESTN